MPRDKKQKVDEQNEAEDERMEEEEAEDEEVDDEEEDDSSDDEIVDDDRLAEMEKLNFDFEALPPDHEDVQQIGNLLTQMFLRTDVKYEELAKAVVEHTPLGCVFKATEECADEENEDAVYGVSSAIRLTDEENFGLGELLVQRAKKYADKEVAAHVEQLFAKPSDSKVALVINERMLHFPTQIAGPTLSALKADIDGDSTLKAMETFVLVLKVRFAEAEGAGDGQPAPKPATTKPKGKAAKKRALADKLSAAEMVYDNEEEALLFEANADATFPHFQYPVHFDVEKGSKFHVVRRDGIAFYPYRRVCLLTKEQLFAFFDKVIAAFS
ncbi:hypothetical protein M3Y99_01132800 [Aphelenchoides fujianensis]|nr:hypothetical protein M3Y99_01132800 [Aphelenchoides fujianensis]